MGNGNALRTEGQQGKVNTSTESGGARGQGCAEASVTRKAEVRPGWALPPRGSEAQVRDAAKHQQDTARLSCKACGSRAHQTHPQMRRAWQGSPLLGGQSKQRPSGHPAFGGGVLFKTLCNNHAKHAQFSKNRKEDPEHGKKNLKTETEKQ